MIKFTIKKFRRLYLKDIQETLPERYSGNFA